MPCGLREFWDLHHEVAAYPDIQENRLRWLTCQQNAGARYKQVTSASPKISSGVLCLWTVHVQVKF